LNPFKSIQKIKRKDYTVRGLKPCQGANSTEIRESDPPQPRATRRFARPTQEPALVLVPEHGTSAFSARSGELSGGTPDKENAIMSKTSIRTTSGLSWAGRATRDLTIESRHWRRRENRGGGVL
jgi:hypothetical protein